MTVLQPASMTPEPMNRPCARKSGTHLGRVAFEVFGLGAQRLSQFRPVADERADGGHERLDCAPIQQIHSRRPNSARRQYWPISR